MIRTDASVVRPRREGAEIRSGQHAGKGEDGGNEGARPASAQVGEFRDGLREEDLVSVALEVAKDAGAENSGNDDDAEQRSSDVVKRIGVGRIEQDLAISVADGTEIFRRHVEEGKRQPKRKVNVG